MFVQTAFIPDYLNTDIDFVCVLCISSSTAARRQTAHTIHTTSAGMAHANGPTTRCHFSTCPFIFSQLQRSVCTNGIYSLLPQHRYIDFVCVLCTGSSTAAVASLFFLIPLCLCSRVCLTQQYRHFSTYPFIFRSYNEVFVQTALIPYSPSGTYFFSIYDHGPDSLHVVLCDQLTFSTLTGGCSEGLGNFQIFL